MTKDKVFFIISFALLGLVAAYLFRPSSTTNNNNSTPEAQPTKELVEKTKTKGEDILPIAPGKLAVPFQLNARSAIIQFLKPGTLVELRFTSKANVALDAITLILLENIRILAIGADAEGRHFWDKLTTYKENTPVEILLEMTQKQAEVLSYAELSGTITFEIVDQDLPYEYNELAAKLLNSSSEDNFNSILVSHLVQSLFPKSHIKVISTGKGYIVSGTVTSETNAENVIKIIKMLSPEGEKAVVNLLEQSDIVEVLAASKDLKTNQHLSGSDFVWVKINSAEANPTQILRDSKAEKWLDGAIVAKNIPLGNIISRCDLIWPHEGNENQLSEKLNPAPGKRAVPIELSTRSPIMPFLDPGALVDIQYTSKSDLGIAPLNLILLQNIRILSFGKTANGKDFNGKESLYKPDSKIEIFLEMSAEQAEVFSYAQQAGNVSLELMNTANVERHEDLVRLLLKSESATDFQSILISYMIRKIFPKVNVTVIPTSKGFIVQGNVPDPQMAAKIIEIFTKLVPGGGEKAVINMMEVNPQQVLVCVKFYEVGKNVLSTFGLNWKALFQSGTQSLAFGGVYPTIAADTAGWFAKGTSKMTNLKLDALLQMLEEEKKIKVLAEPNLTTVSGETGHFFSGGEFPILTPQGGNLIGTVTVEFKKYGVTVDYTPTVDLNGLITMHIVPEVSDLDPENGVVLSGYIIPGLLTRRVDTTVKLWSGQSYIIGGLYMDEINNIDDHLYGLNKIPLIGSLFGCTHYEDDRTEIMVIVTPYLIQENEDGEYIDTGEPEMNTALMIDEEEVIIEKAPGFIESPWVVDDVFDCVNSQCSY